MTSSIELALEAKRFAVTGVSRYPTKFGHRIYRFLVKAGLDVYAVNPNADCIEDAPCYPSLCDLPIVPDCVVIVTQPWVTTGTVKEAIRLGIKNIWMQPGADSRDGVAAAQEADVNLVFGGPCIMVELNREDN